MIALPCWSYQTLSALFGASGAVGDSSFSCSGTAKLPRSMGLRPLSLFVCCSSLPRRMLTSTVSMSSCSFTACSIYSGTQLSMADLMIADGIGSFTETLPKSLTSFSSCWSSEKVFTVLVGRLMPWILLAMSVDPLKPLGLNRLNSRHHASSPRSSCASTMLLASPVVTVLRISKTSSFAST